MPMVGAECVLDWVCKDLQGVRLHKLQFAPGETAIAVVRGTCLHQDQRCIPCPGSYAARVAILYLEKWKSIFFGIDSSPFVSSWRLGEPLKGSAI